MLRALREFVVRLLLKDSPKGMMTTIPNKDLVDMNVQMLAEKLMRNGINPNSLKNANQVENAIRMIENRPKVQEGIRSTKSAKVFDLEGKEIDPKKGIMGGKQIPDDDLPPPGSRGGPDDIAAPVQSAEESLRDMTEAEIKKRLEKQNKEAIEKIRERKYQEAIKAEKDKMAKDPNYIPKIIDPEDFAQGGRAGFFLGSANPRGLALLREILKYMSKTGQELDKFQGVDLSALDMLRFSNPKRFNKLLEDVRGKVNVKEGIMGTDSVRAMQQADREKRKAITAGVLEVAKDMKAKDIKIKRRIAEEAENTIIPKVKRQLMEGMGMSEEAAEKTARDMAEAAQNMRLTDDPPIITKEGILELENVLKNLETGGKKKRDLNANGGRIGYKIGGIDKARRAFLKAAAGITGGIAALKTGLLNIGKDVDTVKNLPPIKTPVTKLEGTTTEMPEWFPSFINKFRDEGKAENVFLQKKVAVSKAEYDQAAAEGKLKEGNYFMDPRTPEYIAKNPDHSLYNKLVDTDERIYTTYTNDKVPGVRVDDNDGNVDVMFENDYSQPVSINYTAPGKKGPETGRVDIFLEGEAKMETKPKGEFVANDVETYATDPDGGFDTEDVIADSLDDMMEGTTCQMEEYATGKKVKGISKGEGRVVEREIRAEQASDAAAEAEAEAAADAADEFASGGIARMLGE